MKKFVVLLVVVAMSCFSAMAFAADVTVGGSYEVRSRDFNNLNQYEKGTDAATAGDTRDTQNRIRIDVNAKAGDVKGKLELESDFGTGSRDWGTGNDFVSTLGGSGYSTPSTGLGFREAWVNFNIPGIPVNVTAGHQLLALGNAWFFRSMHYGSDAWVVANVTGNNTVAFVNWKVLENNVSYEDDIDAYVFLDMFKISDKVTVGIDFTQANIRNSNRSGGLNNSAKLNNLGLNFNGNFGALKLKFQADQQFGDAGYTADWFDPAVTTDSKFKGNELVLQGNVALDPVTINFTAARGTGQKANTNDTTAYQTFQDIDPHYTFLYEYKVKTAAGAKNTAFSNTTAFGAGLSVAAMKNLTLGFDYWFLQATDLVALNGALDQFSTSLTSRDIGQELDLKLNWQLYDNLSWNWVYGVFMPGAAYDRPATGYVAGVNTSSGNITGLQGVLAFKF
jgi:hypothetical protein